MELVKSIGLDKAAKEKKSLYEKEVEKLNKTLGTVSLDKLAKE